jgi:hypothetical protein
MDKQGEAMGLKPEHHDELNRMGVTRERYAELRQLYADDEKAQRQIDIYDPESEYQTWSRKYRDAANDESAEQEAWEWFERNGYLDL